MKHILDVREKLEYKLGHVKDAISAPLSSLPAKLESLELDKSAEIVVYCASGHRAGIATDYLKKQGYTNVTNGINRSHVEREHL